MAHHKMWLLIRTDTDAKESFLVCDAQTHEAALQLLLDLGPTSEAQEYVIHSYKNCAEKKAILRKFNIKG